jgi:hypothetical protein
MLKISRELIPEERPRQVEISSKLKRPKVEKGDAFHEKSDKRQKQNSGGKRQKNAIRNTRSPRQKAIKEVIGDGRRGDLNRKFCYFYICINFFAEKIQVLSK